MTGETWVIYWNEYAADTYLYGSEVTCHRKDDVEFVNHMMPPGTVIKQWYSKTNYQAQRIEPALPMIDGESDYRLIVDIDTAAGEECQVRLVFYDRYETEVGNITARDRVTDFKCPLKTYSYRMQLLSGGAREFHFHSIIIQEVLHEREETVKTTS
ncbi:accessory Sec system protein Asp3 [Parablautia intestinalis]|uniref:Accessory Sec system protein Asp3 n=1 Tax=Parablautia intestinalis TaxID=2320100 RepID=A0A3A9A749_9FIRM|nr:accessory Sec system protein Asp3 [Parablautia intestinalis]RKI87227.1 accessory Sec system protein Asp3 [Parablautia intestinalis]